MPKRLRSDPQIWRLAADLGLRPTVDPVADIRSFCRRRLQGIKRQFGSQTLSDFLAATAASLNTLFIEVRSDDDIVRTTRNYVAQGELVFASLDRELSADVYAITFHRRNAGPGDRAFVSVIDCRGEKAARAYFSKWHELAHLLTLTNQARLRFRRTHAEADTKDPEEALMDVLAGYGGFFPDLVRPHAKGRASFEKFAKLREVLCPDASEQASLIGFVRAWPAPSLLLRARLGLRKSEQRARPQATFDFATAPTPVLRAVDVTANDEATKCGLAIPPNMRVPQRSIIHRAFGGAGGTLAQGDEDLSWWTSSAGGCLAEHPIRVAARKRGEHVQALISSLQKL